MNGKMDVPMYKHNLHGHDIDALGEEFKRILSGLTISTGPINKEVQQQFAAYMGADYCILTNNWTSGAIAAMLTLGIGPGDEVIVPSMTFGASANVVELVGANTRIVDIDPYTKLMDIDQCLAAVNEKTKAVMPVHLYGQMVDMKELRQRLPSHIKIIEDAAHAIESIRDGHKPGAFSDFAIFSFYAGKTMTTGEGGAMVTNQKALHDRFKIVYRHGIDLSGYQRHILQHYVPSDPTDLGIKANLPDLLAILLPPQIKVADETRTKRQRLAGIYDLAFDSIDEIEIPVRVANSEHAHWAYAIGVDPARRFDIMEEFHVRGIRTTTHFTALHETIYYKNKYGHRPEDFPVSHQWGQSTMSIPLFPTMTEEEQWYVIKNLIDIVRS